MLDLEARERQAQAQGSEEEEESWSTSALEQEVSIQAHHPRASAGGGGGRRGGAQVVMMVCVGGWGEDALFIFFCRSWVICSTHRLLSHSLQVEPVRDLCKLRQL
jgi:hypothetical protein